MRSYVEGAEGGAGSSLGLEVEGGGMWRRSDDEEESVDGGIGEAYVGRSERREDASRSEM